MKFRVIIEKVIELEAMSPADALHTAINDVRPSAFDDRCYKVIQLTGNDE